METLLLILKIVIAVATTFYFILIGNYILRWESIKIFFADDVQPAVFVSVIIAARNEQQDIGNCLTSLVNQNYEPSLFEIIVVNDFSSDATETVVNTFMQTHKNISIRLISMRDVLADGSSSKKRAITEGVKIAKGELILTTDADCMVKNSWIKTVAAYYTETGHYFISCPVEYESNGLNFFAKIQSLEFMSLIGSGGAAIKSGYPLMCNAANLAFKKSVYFEVGRNDVDSEPVSGDDTFLMFAIHKKYPDKISFLKSPEAIVSTAPSGSVADFINQRKRWTSKVKNYSAAYVKWIGLGLFIFNTSIIGSAIFGLTHEAFLKLFLLQLVIKFVIDFVFLNRVSYFFSSKKLLLLFPLVEILHVFYIVLVSVFSFSKKYEWKNRNVNS